MIVSPMRLYLKQHHSLHRNKRRTWTTIPEGRKILIKCQFKCQFRKERKNQKLFKKNKGLKGQLNCQFEKKRKNLKPMYHMKNKILISISSNHNRDERIQALSRRSKKLYCFKVVIQQLMTDYVISQPPFKGSTT